MASPQDQVELQTTRDTFYSVPLDTNTSTSQGTSAPVTVSRNVTRGRAIVVIIACVGLAAATVATIAIFASTGKGENHTPELPDRFVHDVLEDKGLPEPEMTEEEQLEQQLEDNPNPRKPYQTLVAFRKMVQELETAHMMQEVDEEEEVKEGKTNEKKEEEDENNAWIATKDGSQDKEEDRKTPTEEEAKKDESSQVESEEGKDTQSPGNDGVEEKENMKEKEEIKMRKISTEAHVRSMERNQVEMTAQEDDQTVNKEEKETKEKEEDTKEEDKKETKRGAWRKLPQKPNDKGNFICETPECAVAAVTIAESLDLTADPCQDFYQFACGGWVNKHPIPEGELSVTSFSGAQELLDKRLLLILDSEADPEMPKPLHMSRDFFKACKDTDELDKRGLEPLANALSVQGGWPLSQLNWDETAFSLEEALVHVRDINMLPLIGVGIEADMLNTSRKMLYVSNGQSLMSYKVLSNPDQYPEIMDAYKTFITGAGKLMREHYGASGVSDEHINAEVDDLIDFEKKVAKAVMNQVPYYNETSAYIATNIEELQQLTDAGSPGQLDWLTYFKFLFTDTGVTIDAQEPLGLESYPSYFAALSNILATTPKRTVANYLGWTWVGDLSSETTYAMRNLTDDFYKVIAGFSLFDDRTSFCISQTNIDMGLAVSRDYIDMFFPVTARPEIQEVIEDIRYSFRMLISKTNWMDVYNKVYAKEKLLAIEPFTAYPDWIMDDVELTNGYEGLEIDRKEHFDNLVHLGRFVSFISLASYREKPESTFVFPPTVVNAFYNPLYNSITILAGILQPPFYAHNSLAAQTYGGIGVIIGHEMTHGFDNSGRQFDKDGNLVQWWSDETVAAYETRSKCFVDQYSMFYPPELVDAGLDIPVNGELTLGENIADNGGVREAYLAYRLWVDRYGEEPRLPGLEEFSPDHIFYLAYANQWCEHNTPLAVLNQVSTNPHSPGRFRVLGPLSNDEEFSEVWKCPKDSPMNREEERCLLW